MQHNFGKRRPTSENVHFRDMIILSRYFHRVHIILLKVWRLTHKLIASPATRAHIVAIIKADGFSGIFKRIKRMQNDLSRQEKTAPILQIRNLSYEAWSERFDTPNDQETAALCRLSSDRLVHIALFVDDTNQNNLDRTIQSLLNSHRPPNSIEIIFSTKLDHIHRNAILSRAMEISIPHIQDGYRRSDFTILLRAGYEMRPHALALLTTELVRAPEFACLYGDEARYINGRLEHWFKPKYAPIMAQSGRLLTGPIAFNHHNRSATVFFDAWYASPDRLEETLVTWSSQLPRTSIGHLSHVLSITSLAPPQIQKIKPTPSAKPIVSIIIPTRNFWSVLQPCLDSLKKTDWPIESLDIIVIDNGSDDPHTLAGLAERAAIGEIRVIKHDAPFNWSELNNIGAAQARGSVLVFLNNDIEIIEFDWLEKLVSFAVLPQVGAVGCKLLYPDYTVQHGGVILGILGGAGHAHLSLASDDEGYNGLANISREISAVTGACIAVEKEKFNAICGFDESFQVTFNDIALCMKLSQIGLDNIYVADARLVHHESKSRGYDTTPEKIERNRNETIRFWHNFRDFIRSDPFYSPNLSYREPYQLAPFPRQKPRWGSVISHKPRVLMLSVTHAKGHGVAVVLAIQIAALINAGIEVIVVGPKSDNDFTYEGCTFLEAYDDEAAALAAIIFRADCVIAHTPPFFSTVRWLGSNIPFVAYDYGEPPADWFEDREARREIVREKQISFAMADYVYAISQAIRTESPWRFDGILPLGNSHLGQWTEHNEKRRQGLRDKLQWNSKYVVLNVCRFHHGERLYKGIDKYVEMMQVFRQTYPELGHNCIFALCGKGTPADIADMREEGLVVFANVSDETLAELYIAADVYINFSQWEGYNLGIAQALAMGIPTFASDIAAHRAFGVPVSNDIVVAIDWLASEIKNISQLKFRRSPKIWPWEKPLAQLIDLIDSINQSRTP